MNFEEKILLNELKFNDTDDQIIEYINKNKLKFINQSIQKTAQELFTVPNSIVRLSKKLGYNGFSELKFALKQEVDHGNKIDSLESEYGKYVSENIIKTLKLINDKTIEKVVKKIMDSRKIDFLGIGDSIYFCEMFAKNIRCVGKRGEFFQHKHDMMYSANNCDSKDLFIAISVSGESKDIIETCKKAKERGAYIISITHFSENTLSKISNMKLFFWAPYEVKNDYNATDRIGIMILTRIISQNIWNNYNID